MPTPTGRAEAQVKAAEAEMKAVKAEVEVR